MLFNKSVNAITSNVYTLAVIRLVQLCAVVAVVFSVSFPLQAFEKLDLYKAEKLVESQSVAARKEAARLALAELVVRVSGQSDSLESEPVQAALARADRYLLEFRYGAYESHVDDQGQNQQLIPLIMQFSQAAVEKLLRQSQLPLWPISRPEVLLWLVVDDGEQVRQLLTAPERREYVEQTAHKRGLVVHWPLADLEDQLILGVEDLWAQELDSIDLASQRYRADYVLAGRIFKTTSGQWFGSWSLLPDSRLVGAEQISEAFAEFEADSEQVLFGALMNWVAQQLSARYAIMPRGEEDQATYLQVTGVNSFDRYAQLLEKIQALPMVSNVQVLMVAGEELILQLSADGDLAQFQRALNRSSNLVWANQPPEYMPVIATAIQPLHYHWPKDSEVEEFIPQLRLQLPQINKIDGDSDSLGGQDGMSILKDTRLETPEKTLELEQ